MKLSGQVIDLVERAYEVDTAADRWLDAIRDAALKSFRGQTAVQAYTFHVGSGGRFQLDEIASEPIWEDLLLRAHSFAHPEVIRKIYLTSPVQSVYHALVGKKDDPGYQECVRKGIQNITLSLGLDASGHGCALVFLHTKRQSISRPARHALERVSAHLAAAHRLRTNGQKTGAEGIQSETQADAILRPEGEVLHASPAAHDNESLAALREAARRMDRSRTRQERADPERALGMWRALVDGQWSLVERFESDGRRIVIARRNAPATHPLKALNLRERKVISLLVLGHSLKLCAYELGLAESTVSETSRSAITKLGVGSRAELIELYGALVPEEA